MIKKILILLSTTIALFALWIIALEKIYAQILTYGASLILSPFPKVTPVLKLDQAHPDFCVAVGNDGYCMQLELFGLSIIIILSWYVLLNSIFRTKKILFLSAKRLLLFYMIQIIAMSTLALYDYGTFFQQLNDALRQSFIIIALVFIIWDNYLFGIFQFGKKTT